MPYRFNPLSQALDYYETGSGGSSNTNERLQNEDRDATYAYVGYENTSDSSWYIYRRTRATNVREYATGASSYATNWTNRNVLIYTQPNEHFVQTNYPSVDVSYRVQSQIPI